MFERFTEPARRVVALAQEGARLHKHNYIGTEHLLWGLAQESPLVEGLITREEVSQKVEELVGDGQQEPMGHIPFTPRLKKVLALSLREALQLGHDYVAVNHIILGILREGGGVAIDILGDKVEALGEKVREEALKYPVNAPERPQPTAADKLIEARVHLADIQDKMRRLQALLDGLKENRD